MRVGLGDGGCDPSITNTSEFKAAWAPIEKQLRAEGGDDFVVAAAQTTLCNSFSGLLNQPGVDPHDALNAASQLTTYAHTAVGAAGHIESLISAAQSGAPPSQVVGQVGGLIVGVLVATSAVTAGAGAALIAGLAVAGELLDKIGLFGKSGVRVCDNVSCDPPPKFVVNCVCFYDPIVQSPSSPNWRKFPDPSNQDWFGPYVWFNRMRKIDAVFPEFRQLECEAATLYGSAPQEQFLAAFYGAWKANKEYALNGLNAAPDWQVLINTVRMWNLAHEDGAGYSFYPADPQYLLKPPGPGDLRCTTPSILYVSTLVNDVLNNSNVPKDVVRNGRVFIHTGPKKRPRLHIVPGGINPNPPPQPSTMKTTGLSTPAKVAVGVAATAGAGLATAAIVAWIKKQTINEVLSAAWRKTKKAVGR